MAAPHDKGFIDWKPNKSYQVLLDQVLDVQAKFRLNWGMMQRTWLYRLKVEFPGTWIKAHRPKNLPNGKPNPAWDPTVDATYSQGGMAAEYPELNYLLKKGRRSGLIDPRSIAPQRGEVIEAHLHDDADDMLRTLQSWANQLQLDRQAGQKRRIVLWCETEGWLRELESLAEEYSCDLMTGSGADTLTRKLTFADRVSNSDLPVTVLHVGDLDPSGEMIHEVGLEEDVQVMLHGYKGIGGDLVIERIAILDRHIDDYGLAYEDFVPKADDKSGHEQYFVGLRKCEAEAFAPADLIALVRDAIESRMDMAIYDAVLNAETAEHQIVMDKVDTLFD